MNIHIGQIIKRHFDESGMTLTAFADKTYLQRQNIKKSVFEKTSIDTEILVRISKVLGHNFFQYYLDQVPERQDSNLNFNEPNEFYSVKNKKRVTVSFEIDDPDIKNQLIDLIRNTA